MEKEIVIAVFGASVGLAGVLLVFVTFVYSRVESFQSVPKQKKYKIVARIGLLPFLIALISAWLSLRWLQYSEATVYRGSIVSFQIAVILTALYGLISLMFFL